MLRETINTTFTARHSLGDKSIDVQSSEGVVPAKGNERRDGAAQGRIRLAYARGTEMLDGTGDTLTKATLQAPVVDDPIGTPVHPAEPEHPPRPAGLRLREADQRTEPLGGSPAGRAGGSR